MGVLYSTIAAWPSFPDWVFFNGRTKIDQSVSKYHTSYNLFEFHTSAVKTRYLPKLTCEQELEKGAQRSSTRYEPEGPLRSFLPRLVSACGL